MHCFDRIPASVNTSTSLEFHLFAKFMIKMQKVMHVLLYIILWYPFLDATLCLGLKFDFEGNLAQIQKPLKF